MEERTRKQRDRKRRRERDGRVREGGRDGRRETEMNRKGREVE